MNSRTLSIVLCLPVAFTMCHSGAPKKPGDPVGNSAPEVFVEDTLHIDFRKCIDNQKDIYLSDIADSVTYVPLETTPKFLIGEQSVRVKPCGEYLFISEHGKPVGVFTRSGKFVRTIGKIGRGPGEYNPDFLFWPDSTLRQVIIWNAYQSSLTVYSFDGEYISDIKPELRIGTFAPLGHSRFVCWTFWQGEAEGKFFNLFIHNGKDDSQVRFYGPQKKPDIRQGIMTPMFTPTREGYLFTTWLTDTIHRIKTDGTFRPALTWSLGSLKMPFSGIGNYERFMREKDRYVLDVSACETATTWYMRYYYKGSMQMAICSRTGQEAFSVSNPDTLNPGVYNDIDGGPSFWPFVDNENGRVFVKVFNAIDLLALKETPKPAAIPVRFPAKAEAFQKLIAELDENSNPVVMLVTLR